MKGLRKTDRMLADYFSREVMLEKPEQTRKRKWVSPVVTLAAACLSLALFGLFLLRMDIFSPVSVEFSRAVIILEQDPPWQGLDIEDFSLGGKL